MEKYFTLEEANHALTLVRPIVSDIVTKIHQAKKLHAEVKKQRSAANAKIAINESVLLQKLQETETLLNQIEYHMKELSSVGVLLKDLELGIVDFPALAEGGDLHLCWKLGEATIAYAHSVKGGFANRIPICSAVPTSTSKP